MKIKTTLRFVGLNALICLIAPPIMAQTPPPPSLAGQVESVDVPSRTLKIKAEDGVSLNVALAEKATVVKVAPGEKSLQNAAPIAFEGIAEGDRVLVRGGIRAEGRIDGAIRVIIMAKTDLAARSEEEQRDWRERGVAGTVTSSDAANGEFTIKTSGSAPALPAASPAPAATATVVVDVKKATLHRYADTSVKFEDAKPATAKDLATGDQVRVLGTKSADGSRITADRVVFGSFKTMALAIEKIDAATGLLSVKDLESNKKFTLTMVAGGSIRRIPAEMGAMMAMAMATGGGRPGGPRPGGAPDAGGGTQGAGRPEVARGAQGRGDGANAGMGGTRPGMGGRGQGGPRNGRGMDDMVERMPTITLADLKKDDWIGAVVGKIDASGKATAFNMLAGIEVFAARANRSGGVDVGMPAGLLDGALGVP